MLHLGLQHCFVCSVMEECVPVYVYPLLFNNRITNNFIERNIWVTTGIDHNTLEHICVTYRFTVFFPALLTGSLEISCHFITSTFQTI